MWLRQRKKNTLKRDIRVFGFIGETVLCRLDEFQQITEYPEKRSRGFVAFLYSVPVQCELHLCRQQAAYDARDVHFIEKAVYQSTQPLTIGPIQQDEYANLLQGIFLYIIWNCLRIFSIRFMKSTRTYLVCAVSS